MGSDLNTAHCFRKFSTVYSLCMSDNDKYRIWQEAKLTDRSVAVHGDMRHYVQHLKFRVRSL